MMTMASLRIVLFALLFGQAALLAADASTLSATAAEYIIQKFVRLQKPARKDWTYREHRRTETLAANGLARKSTRSTFQWLTRGDQRESRLLELDGRSVAGRFIKDTPPPGLDDLDLEKVADRYNFKIIQFERMHDRDVARVHFSPKRQQPQARKRLEKVLSKLEGDLWVILEERQLVKAYTLLTEPVKFGGGILGQVNRLEISYALQQVGSQWVAESFQFEIDMRRFLRVIRTRELRNYLEFREPTTGDSNVTGRKSGVAAVLRGAP